MFRAVVAVAGKAAAAAETAPEAVVVVLPVVAAVAVAVVVVPPVGNDGLDDLTMIVEKVVKYLHGLKVIPNKSDCSQWMEKPQELKHLE